MTLISRLEQAEAGSRELDSLIAKQMFPDRDWVAFEEDGVDIWWSRCPYESDAFDGPAKYTTSMDAAMSLAKEKRIRMIIAEDNITDVLVDGTQGCGATPALALCVASLKAAGYE